MKNVTKEEVMELIKDFPYEPRFNKIVITLNNLEEDGNLVLSDNILSETQYVLAVGPMVNGLKPGDKVLIDVEKIMVPERQEVNNEITTVMRVKIKPLYVGENVFTMIEDRVVDAIDNTEDIKL